jgi:hypothetical protein
MDETDTLSGRYGTAKMIMPDGQEIPCLARKVPRGDGSFGWVIIDDRVLAYEASQAHTDYKAADHIDAATEAITKRPTTISTTSEDRKGISLDLLQFLGDPDPVIANGGFPPEKLAAFKAHPLSVTMARRLCLVYGGKWATVLKFLPKFYPDSRPGG